MVKKWTGLKHHRRFQHLSAAWTSKFTDVIAIGTPYLQSTQTIETAAAGGIWPMTTRTPSTGPPQLWRQIDTTTPDDRERSEPTEFIPKTVYNSATGLYEEELIPLREAYQDAVKRIEDLESERDQAARGYQAEDIELQRKWWRETGEQTATFQRFVTENFQKTINSARTTYRLLTAMSIALFATGLGLFLFAALYATLANSKAYSLVFAGLGASSFVALFIVRPFEDAQVALSNMIQGEMGFMSYFEQVRMWASYPWVNGQLDGDKAETASRTLHERTTEAMEDFERFLEPIRGTKSGGR